MARLNVRISQPFQTVARYLGASVQELRRVVWPSREQTVRYTLIVIGSVVIVTALTAALDYGLSNLIEQLIAWSQP